MIMTIVRNEGGKRTRKEQRRARNSCSSEAVGLPTAAAKATTMQFSIIQSLALRFGYHLSFLVPIFPSIDCLFVISCPSVHRKDRDQKRLVLAKIFLMFSSWKCWSLFILTSRLGERTIIILVLQMRNLRLSDIPKVIQLVRSGGRIWVMGYLNLESCFYPLWSPASMLHSLLTCSHLL